MPNSGAAKPENNLAEVIPLFPTSPNLQVVATSETLPPQSYIESYSPPKDERIIGSQLFARVKRLGSLMLDLALEKRIGRFEAYDKIRGRRGHRIS